MNIHIVFDNMGTGRSSKPNRPYTIEEMADHAAAILDAAKEKQANVMGFSMGGMIAQELALRHPDRVHLLVLGCAQDFHETVMKFFRSPDRLSSIR